MVTQWSDHLNLLHASNVLRTIDSTTGSFDRGDLRMDEIFTKTKKKKMNIFGNNFFFLERNNVLLNDNVNI